MRVFVLCDQCQEKIYLNDVRDHRSQYPPELHLKCSSCGHHGFYHRGDLEAESGTNAAVAGLIAGGAAGTLAGPIGNVVGAGIGAVLGSNVDDQEKQKVEAFYDVPL